MTWSKLIREIFQNYAVSLLLSTAKAIRSFWGCSICVLSVCQKFGKLINSKFRQMLSWYRFCCRQRKRYGQKMKNCVYQSVEKKSDKLGLVLVSRKLFEKPTIRVLITFAVDSESDKAFGGWIPPYRFCCRQRK